MTESEQRLSDPCAFFGRHSQCPIAWWEPGALVRCPCHCHAEGLAS